MNNRTLSTALSTLGAALTLYAAQPAARAQETAPSPQAPAPQTAPTPAQTPAASGQSAGAGQAAAGQTARRYPLLRVNRPFRFQLGSVLTTEDRTRDDVSDSLFFAAFSADLAATRNRRSVIFSAYLDVTYGQNDGDAPINRVESIGIGLSARTYLAPETRATRFYVGAGLGAYTISGKRDRLITTSDVIQNVPVSRTRYFADDDIQTTIGGKAFVGAEFDRRFFAEVGFTATGSAQDYSPTGGVFSAGVRF